MPMVRGTSWISIPAKHKQCSVCGKIEVGKDEWFLPLEAITQKGVKPNDIINIPECPQCKDTITFKIITNAFPVIPGI